MRDALFLLAVLGIAWAPGLAALAWIWAVRRDLRCLSSHVDLHCNVVRIHDQRLLSLGQRLIAHEEGRPWAS